MKYEIIALTIGNRYLGVVEAESREEAIEKAESWPEAQSEDITEIVAERSED